MAQVVLVALVELRECRRHCTHHQGSPTYIHAGLTCSTTLTRNNDRFYRTDIWGEVRDYAAQRGGGSAS
jgi:hypothetical protein